MGILQARVLEWVAMPFSRGSSNPGIKPRSPTLQVDSLLSEPPGKPDITNQLSHSVRSDSLWPMDCSPPGFPVHHQLQELLKLMSIALVMPSNHLILCRPLLFLPSIFPSVRVFSNELVLHIRWPKYWSFRFSISPSNEYSGLTSFKIGWISLQSKGLSRVFSNTTVQKHQFFGAQCSLQSKSYINAWPLEKA